jgi:hypothetical protein
MRFRTIWTIPAMSFAERLRRTRDWFALYVGHKLPLRIRYWIVISEIGYATRNGEDLTATPCSEILNNLRRPKVVS